MNEPVVISNGRPEVGQIVLGLCFTAFGLGLPVFTQDFIVGLVFALPLLPFSLAGLFALVWRTGAWIDLDNRELVTWSRGFGRRKETRNHLNSFEKVTFSERSARRHSRSYTVYPVSLVSDVPVLGIRYSPTALMASGAPKRVELYCFTDQAVGEEQARKLAEALDLPLEKHV